MSALAVAAAVVVVAGLARRAIGATRRAELAMRLAGGVGPAPAPAFAAPRATPGAVRGVRRWRLGRWRFGRWGVGQWRLGRCLAAGLRRRRLDPVGGLVGWWRARPARRHRAVAAGLPGLLEDVARLLRSGASLRQALLEAPTTSPAPGPAEASLAAVMTRAERGEPLGDALARWASLEPVVEVRLAVAALQLASTGGAAAQAVDGIAATLRERQSAAAEVGVQSAQARLSAAVIAALPVVFTLWCVATDDRAAGFLFASPAGLACLGLGGALLAVGAWWMARIVASVR